ncbi:MAG: creatininase family protein [Clostridiales bacterium]|nr:creatininase family protein [Clostridiales bacterium]
MPNNKTVMLEEMTWPEVSLALENGMDTVIIPAGSIEQHGPHLALLTDSLLGANAASELAKRLGNALVAPIIRPGLSSHHMSFPGTISLRPEVFTAIIEDYVESYAQHGFKNMILVSTHGGNTVTIEKMLPELKSKYKDIIIIASAEVPTNEELEELARLQGLPTGACGGHADDRETSEMLYLAPQHTRMDQAEQGFIERVDEVALERFFQSGVQALSKIGVVGDPCNANAERGAWYIKQTADRLERDVRNKLAKEGVEIG